MQHTTVACVTATLPFIWRLTIRVDDGGGGAGGGGDVTMLVNIVIMVVMVMNLSWTGDTARGRYRGSDGLFRTR